MNEFESMLLENYYTGGQLARIQKVRTGIAGAGGLGSNIAFSLIRSGFNKITIADFDKVELSNLNRQNYEMNDIGKFKTEALKQKLLSVNSSASINTFNEKLEAENISDVFKDADVVFEAFDRAEYKRMFFETLRDSGKMLVFGNGVAGIDNLENVCVKKYSDKIFFIGDGETSTDNGVKPYAPKVAMCAAMMVGVVLREVVRN